jgi:hypothetical protein
MKIKNFSLWGWIALLLLFLTYNGEAFAQQGGYGGYHMGSGKEKRPSLIVPGCKKAFLKMK